MIDSAARLSSLGHELIPKKEGLVRRLAALVLLCGGPIAASPAVAQSRTLGYVASTEGVVIVFDTADHSVVAEVPTGELPLAIAFTPDGTRAYVVNRFSDSVTVIDTADYRVVATIPVGAWPSAVAVAPDGAKAYVPCWNSNAVDVVDTATNSVVKTIVIPTGGNPFSAAITPDGRLLYVTGANSTVVSVVDTAIEAVVDAFSLETGYGTVTLSPDGSRLYVATDPLYVIDTANRQVIDTIALPSRCIVLAPDGQRAWVTTYDAVTGGGVALIDTTTYTVMDHILIPASPVGVAVTPDGQSVYVGSGSTDLIAIDTSTRQWSYVLSLGYSAWAVAIAPPRVVTVAVDVLPESIHPSTNQAIPVAVVASETFDAATIDPTTVRFGRTGVEASPLRYSLRDVDHDGLKDLLLQFSDRDTGIQCGTVSVALTGRTSAGRPFAGTDRIRTVGCR